MIKLIPPGSQDLGYPLVSVIKRSSRGLRGSDLSQLIERAGAKFAAEVKGLEFGPGEEPVHAIILGATERYGVNKNFDGWLADMCRRCHNTFPKYARIYRDHHNKNPERSYGVIKASSFNEDMQRIELVAAFNATREAADRNGGLVADLEMNKLASGQDMALSHACRVPFDQCSACQHKAARREDYCLGVHEGGSCPYGGLRHNIGKVAEDGHVLHADNPEGKFFDCSHVTSSRQADRIAYLLGPWKEAQAPIKSGAELADELGLVEPYQCRADEFPEPLRADLRSLHDLLLANENWSGADPAGLSLLEQRRCPELSQVKLASERRTVLLALAEQKVLLPVPEFLSLETGQELSKIAALAEQVEQLLPEALQGLAQSPVLENLLASSPYRFVSDHAQAPAHALAVKCASLYGLDLRSCRQRAGEAVWTEKSKRFNNAAPVSAEGQHWAQRYALYKTALAGRWRQDQDGPRLLLLLAGHNALAAK